MYSLLVSQNETFERRHEVLEINFVLSEQRFYFQYWENEGAKERWARDCEAAEGFRMFERFLELKKWFS
ncbi:MAG: hypothetical protein EOP09_14210 [Proteobacteria bacterium]|nr:MAG: hypothetical protein EOP09_14210 [Pseudomonadota bacterium]